MTVRIQGSNGAGSPGFASVADTGVRPVSNTNIDFVIDGTTRSSVTANGFSIPTGNLTLTDGNLVVAEGHGINFHPQGASDVNLLDDYETGTFVPGWSSTTATNLDQTTVSSYDTRLGTYTKIGRQVTCYIWLRSNPAGWNWINGGAAAQFLTIVGLPFPIGNQNLAWPTVGQITFYTYTGNPGWGGFYQWYYGTPGTTRARFIVSFDTASTAGSTTAINTVGNQQGLKLTYFTDD